MTTPRARVLRRRKWGGESTVSVFFGRSSNFVSELLRKFDFCPLIIKLGNFYFSTLHTVYFLSIGGFDGGFG